MDYVNKDHINVDICNDKIYPICITLDDGLTQFKINKNDAQKLLDFLSKHVVLNVLSITSNCGQYEVECLGLESAIIHNIDTDEMTILFKDSIDELSETITNILNHIKLSVDSLEIAKKKTDDNLRSVFG